MTLGKKIRQFRVDYAYTCRELAEMLGTSVYVISRWENDKAVPSFRFIQRLARTFHCDPTEFTRLIHV